VIDSHGGLGQRDRVPEVQAAHQSPDADAGGAGSHQGQGRRTVEHRVPHPIRLHDRVAVPEHVESKPFGLPPSAVEHVERQMLVLVGTEA
jgi:hypothetical protein